MESITSHIGVVVVAGGSGSRMGGNLPKQFMLLDGQPILARTINNFAEALPGAEIVVVLPADYIDFWQDYARRFDVAEHRTTAGGAERFHSVANGIAALSDACDLIAVQDGVRPLATHEAIRRIARTAEREGSAIPVVQPVDSFRIVTAEGASHPVERATLRIVQTPQFFRAELLRKTDERLAALYARRSGRPQEEFAQRMAENNGNGRWLSPEETVAAGLADRIVEGGETAEGERSAVRNLASGWNRLLAAFGLHGAAAPADAAREEDRRNILHLDDADPAAGRSAIEAAEGQRRHRATQVLAAEDPSVGEIRRSANEAAYAADARQFKTGI